MKKYILLNLLCLFTLGTSLGQITYTGISFPQAGDILSISTAVDSALTVTPPSATATAWDFSHLTALNTNYDTVQAASSGASFSMFPSTDILQPLVGQIGTAYTDVTTTQIERIGGGIEFMGISFINAYSNTHITQIAPLTYNDAATDDYVFRFSQHIDSVPFLRQLIDSLVSGLPLSPDSIRIALDGDEERLVDAWGTCTMADSTYDVLRQKVVTDFLMKLEISVDIPFAGVQWFDLTAFVPLPFPTSGTIVQYNFLAEGVKQPLVSLTLDSAETMITNIEFLDTVINNPPTSIQYIEDVIAAKVFPNPAQQVVQIQIAAADMPKEGYSLYLVDMLGRIVLTETTVNESLHQVSTQGITNGRYVLVLSDGKGRILQRSALEIRK